MSQETPLVAAWVIIKLGGWVPLLYLFLYAVKEVHLINVKKKWERKQKYVLLAIDVPKGNEQSPKAVENIFAHLYGAKSSINLKEKWIIGKFQQPFSLEIVSHGGDIRFYLRTPLKHRDLAEAAVFSQYPDAVIVEAEDYTKEFPRKFPNDDYTMFGCDFKQDRDYIYPIRTYPQFEHTLSGEFKDPMSLVMETLGKIDKKQWVCLQLLIWPLGEDWRSAGVKKLHAMLGRNTKNKKGLIGETIALATGLSHEFVAHAVGVQIGQEEKRAEDPFRMLNLSPGERRILEGVEFKLSKVGFISKLRFVQFSPPETFYMKYYEIKGFLRKFAALDSNGFGAAASTVPMSDYFWQRWFRPMKQRALMKAYCGRDGQYGGPRYPLNIEELATLWHFPVKEVKAPLIKKTEAKRAEPPRGLPIR